MFKKIASFVLALVLIAGTIPLQSYAVHAILPQENTGTTKDGLVYAIVEDYGDSWVEITGYVGTPTEVVIPENIQGLPVLTIRYGAFEYCETLTSVLIPSSVSDIGSAAFRWCTNLTNVSIPNTVYHVGDGAFAACEKLTHIDLEDGNPFLAMDEDGVLYSEHQTRLIYAPSSLSGKYSIPQGVTDIGFYAFEACRFLTELTIPEGITEIPFSSFSNCSSLVNVSIPDSVTSIMAFAFESCTSLTSINIPEGVTHIEGYGAFRSCTNLESVTFPSSLISIGDCVFQGCTSLTNLAFPEGLTSIGEYAFADCTSLDCVSIPASVTSIGSMAFISCENLTGFRVSEDNLHYTNDEFGVLFNKARTELIQAPCVFVTTYTIPAGVQTIAVYAFSRCTELVSITIPYGVTEIPSGAFSYCDNLQDVYMPDSITTIYFYAFNECTSLSHISIPASVTKIDGFVFAKCEALTKITFRGSAPTFHQNTFVGITATVYYPAGNKSWKGNKNQNYGGNITWKPHNQIRGQANESVLWEILDSQLIITPSATSLSENSVSLHSDTSVQCWISDYVDATQTPWYPYQEYIGYIVIKDGVESIGANAFSGMESVVSIYIGSDVTSIGSNAFAACNAVETVVFYGTAPEIETDAFAGTAASIAYPADDDTWSDETLDAFGDGATHTPFDHNVPIAPNPRNNPFDDVGLDAFYYKPVLWAIENGITNGISATEFGPNADCNRAQVVTFLWRAAGCPEPAVTENPFVDVQPGSFYEKAVLWAVEKGITTGTDATHFSPNMACNRATVVTFLYRAFEAPAVAGAENPFTDVPAESWYTAPVLWAVENGITNGMGEGLFGSETACNRAQIVTFLQRAYTE